jgi:uncharacterized coiled-coil protein SlyX
MVSVAKRVAFLEGQSAEQAAATAALRDGVAQLGRDVGELRGSVNELRGSVNQLRTELHGSITDLRGEMNRRFERLEDRLDRRVTWLVGTQVALLLAVVGALAAPYFR